MIGPQFDLVAARFGVNPAKARTILMTITFVLLILAVGLRIASR